MWRHKVLLLTLTLSFISYASSYCAQITLSKCGCKYPKAKRYEIHCEYSGLESLPGKKNYNLTEGDVSGDFSHNAITKIPDFYFLHMKYFDILDFSSNRISSFNENTLAGLETKLRYLNLSKNRITSIPEKALKPFSRLDHLDLSKNEITSPCLIDTADVTNLSLADNGISSLKDHCFADSTKVVTLDLSENVINTIGTYAFQGMASLEVLNLANNKLSDLGEGLNSLADLTTFQSLSLKRNLLEDLGSLCTTVLRSISQIDVSYNDLSEIKIYCFKGYSTSAHDSPTITLNFEHNRLTALAAAVFAGLDEKLTHLQLNNNGISDVNVHTFKNLRKLVHLNLDNNQITSLEFLKALDENTLQNLTIANNLISSLSNEVFKKMMKLTRLSLDGNRLLDIESTTFTGMSVLDELSLRYNLLTNIADGAFTGLVMLKKLSLSGNALITLKNCSFANLDRLVQFHFEDNLLHCDCDLHWLVQFTDEIRSRGGRDVHISAPVLADNCHSPKLLDGDFFVNAVSQSCPPLPSNKCYGLEVELDEPVGEAMNVTWQWADKENSKGNSKAKSIYLSQTEIESGELRYNASVKGMLRPITLPVVQDDEVYKICVSIGLTNGEKEKDCTVYPRMIKKPTTTMAPTTEFTTIKKGLSSGDTAAICLGVLLIIIIILIVLFAIYLWRTKKYRDIMPRKYSAAADSDHDSSSGRSPSSNGKSDPLDFRTSGEEDPMLHNRPRTYEEHDL